MANDKKFIVKNGLLTPQNVVIGSNSDTGENLQVTGTSKLSGNVQITQSTAETPSIDVHNSGGYLSEAIVARFRGDSDSLQIINTGIGDYKLVNSQQNNGIIFYDSTPGVRILYNNAARLDINSAGNRFYGLSTTTIDNNRILTTADEGSGNGLDADTVDGLDSLQFVRADVDDIMAGNYTIQQDLVVSGNLTVSGTTTTINTEEILLADNIITLNSNYTGSTPTENAGIEIERGTLNNPKILWDETSDYWKLISGNLTDLGRIITTADEGSGNGFDADTVDGLQASQFLRSDVDDTAAGNITIQGDLTLGDNVGGAQINFDGVGNNRTLYSESGVIGFLNQAFNYAARSTVDGDWIVERDVQADRNLIAQTNITATTGDITATAGDVIAGDSITAQNNITATTGNIAASAGSVSAGTTVTAGTDVIGQRFVDADNNSYVVNPAGTSTMNDIGIDDDLFHNGDTNTKLSFGTDDISLQTGGVERLGIDNDSVDSTVTFTAPSVGIDTDLFHNGDTDTKISFTTDEIDINTGGATRLTANTTGIHVTNLTASANIIGNNISAITEVESPIYYDKDDRNYYGNFATTSRVNDISLVGEIIADGDTNTYLDFNAADSFQIVTGGSQRFLVNNSYVQSSVDFRAPRFIDSDNTSYYLDPSNATLSLVANGELRTDYAVAVTAIDGAGNITPSTNGIRLSGYGVIGNRGTLYITNAGGEVQIGNGTIHNADPGLTVSSTRTTSLNNVYAPIYYDSNNEAFYGDFASTTRLNDISLVGEIIADGDTNTFLDFNAADSFQIVAGGIGIFTATSTTVTVDGDLTVTGTITGDDANFTGDVSANNITATTAIYSPIYYDADNNGYYGDFAGTSVFNRISIDDYVVHNGDTNTYIGFSAADTFDVVTDGTTRLTVDTTYVTSALDGIFPNLFAFRYYDAENATYYTEPAATSRMNDISLVGEIIHDGDTDTYLEFNAANSFRVVTGGSQRLLVNNSYVLATPQMRAPIYYDNDNTAYYGNFAGTSVMNDIDIDDYVRHNGDTDTYIGFDAVDNFGVWTNNVNRLRITNTNSTFSHDLLAPRFVDSGDNNYYVDPANASLSATLNGAVRIGSIANNSRWSDNSGNGGISLLSYGDDTATSNPSIAVSGNYAGAYALLYLNRIDPNANPFNVGNRYIEFRHDGTAGGTIRGDASGNLYQILAAGTNWGFWTSGASEALIVDDNGDVMIAAGASPTYTDGGDNTPLVGTNNPAKLHVGGSIYLNNNDDAIIFGRGTGSFLKNEELAFGWGSGWYMTDATYLRVRNNTAVYSTGDYYGSRFYATAATAYYLDPDGDSQLKTIDIDDYIRHRGDTNTYFGFSANDTFRVWTNAVRRLNIDNNSADFAVNVYAPSFIDSDNNAFFIDGNSTSVLRYLNVYSGDTVGEFNVGRDSTQRIRQYITDGIGYIQYWQNETDTTDHSLRFEIISSSTGINTFQFNRPISMTGSGAAGYIYAGRFVDSDNNNYYADPASTSVFANLTLDGNGGDAVLKFGPGVPANDDAHIEWKGGSNAGYLRFSTSDDLGTEYMEFGDYDEQNRVGAFTRWGLMNRDYFSHTSDIRAPIFYDSDNTAYYGDFASTSVLNKLHLSSAASLADGTDPALSTTVIYATSKVVTSRLVFLNDATGDDNYIQHSDDNAAYTVAGQQMGAWFEFVGDKLGASTNNSAGIVASGIRSVYGQFNSQVMSPIFYDQNNTNYYGNFASISSMYGIAVRGDTSSTDSGNQIFFWGTGDTTTSAIGFKSNGGEFANPTGNGDGYNTYLTMDTAGRGWVFRRGTGGSDFTSAFTSGWILNNGVWQAQASMRAPIFYDSNNTAYYTDPAADSQMNTIDIDDYVRHRGDTNTYFGFPANDTFQVWTNGNQRVNVDNDSADFGVNVYAPRYYDSNDATYYADPAGDSYMYGMNINIGNEDVGGANASVVGLVMRGNYNSNTWAHKFHKFDHSGGVPIYLSQTAGTGNWSALQRWGTYTGNSYTSQIFGNLAVNTDIRSPIFYDLDNTGYYVDPANSTRLNTIQALRYYFNHNTTYYMDQASGNYGSVKTGGATGGWSGYAIEDWWVFMADSVNTAGIYNDTDNEWAVLARRNAEVELYYNGVVQAETQNGYFLANNQMRAPIFYDSNNTAYYVNPASDRAATLAGRIYRQNFTNNDGASNYFLEAQDLNHWIWSTATNWGIFWNTSSSAAYRHVPFADNQISFVGSGNVRASIDLDNGNAFFGGQVYANNYNIIGPGGNISLNPAYGSGGADLVLFDFTPYSEAELTGPIQGNESLNVQQSEYVERADAPFAGKVIETSAYRQFYSDYIPTVPGEELYGEISVQYVSGSGGLVYYGIERFDKNKNPIAGNTGTTYFVVGGANYTSTAWTTYRNHTTLPTSHTPYNGSDGGGVHYVRIRILMNHSAGGALRRYGGIMLKRRNAESNLLVDDLYALDRIDAVGIIESQASVRAPIFYDRNDTTWYVDPASESRVNELRLNRLEDAGGSFLLRPGTTSGSPRHLNLWDSTGDPSQANGGTGITWGQRGDNNPYYLIWTSRYNNGYSTYSRLRLGWHTGVEIGGNPAYGGTRFFSDAPGISTTELMSVGRGDSHVRVTNNFYAPIMYDSNNTGYYVDPAGTSNFNALNVQGTLTSNGIYYVDNVQDYDSTSITGLTNAPISTRNRDYNVGTSNTYLPLTHQTALYNSGYRTHLNTGLYKVASGWGDGSTGWYAAIGGNDSYPTQAWYLTYGGYIQNSLGYVLTSGSFRAPIFYDLDNTAYYLDPTATTNIRYLKVNTTGSSSPTRALTIKNDGQGEINFGAYPASWTSALQIQNNNNTDMIWISPLDDGYSGRFRMAGAGLDFYTDGTVVDTGTHSAFIGSGYIQGISSIRGPIFYDSNDTNYYVDPANISHIKHLEVAAVTNAAGYSDAAIEVRELNYGGAQADTYAIAPRISFHWGGRVASQIAVASNGEIRILNNPGTATENFRASIGYFDASARSPIFYDLNDTAYYGDFAGTSRLANLLIERTQTTPNLTVRRTGSAPSNNVTAIFENEYRNHSWGLVAEFRTGAGGGGDRPSISWSSAITGTTWSAGMFDGDNWQVRQNHGYRHGSWGTTRFNIDTSGNTTFYNGVYAPIYYDSDNSAYYLDPTGNTNLTRLLFYGKRNWESSEQLESGHINLGWRTMTHGRKVYPDEEFNDGTNGTEIYNNFGGSALSRARISDASAPNESKVIYRYTLSAGSNGTTPGFGGFYFAIGTVRNRTIVCKWRARMAAGRVFNFASNPYGNNASAHWLTDQVGTGKWEEYAFIVRCGDSGSFSSTMFFYVTGGASTGTSFDLAAATCYIDTDHERQEARRYLASNSMYSPIYYDNNDSSYYLDPNTTGTSLNVRGEIRNPSVWINDGDNFNNYNENIRLFNAPNGVSVIAFSASGTGGTPATSILGYPTYLETRRSGTWEQRIYAGYAEARGSYRAPLFYDSNNTGYYVDPAAGSQMSAVYANNWFRAQGSTGFYFESYGRGMWAPEAGGNSYGTVTTQGGGRNGWQGWGIGSRHVFMSTGGDNVGIHDNSRGWIYYWNGSYNEFTYGYTIMRGSARAPIFYDVDNTAYYVNPASNTYLYGNFQVNGGHGDSQIGVRLLSGNNGAGTGEVNLRMWTSEPGVTWDSAGFGYNVTNNNGAPNGFGRINGAHGQAYMRFDPNGNLYFYNTNTGGTRYTNMELYSNNTVYFNNYATGGNSLRAPIFYDSNNTGYFADPAGRSRLSSMDYGDGGYYFAGGDWGYRHNTPYGWIQFGPANSSYAHIYTDRGNFYFNVNEMYMNGRFVLNENYWINNKYFGSDGAIYGTIFYDSNNSAYYYDGASDNSTRMRGVSNETMAHMALSGQTRSSTQYYQARARITSDQNYWTGSMGWGTVDMNTVADWGSGFIDSWSNPGNQPAGTSHWVGTQAYHYSNGSARYGWQMVGGPIAGLWFRNTWASFSGWRKIVMYGLNEYSTDLWASILYDSNDSGYYCDPNGTNRFNNVDTNSIYSRDWFRNNNSGQGLYNQSTGMHIYSNNGYIKHAGGGYGYGGVAHYNNYESDIRGTSGYFDSSGFGMLNSSGNWQLRIEYGNANMELYRVTYGNDIRAYIFYDRNDTGYYVDPNGTSNLGRFTNRTHAAMNRGHHWITPRFDYTGDSNYWTGTFGWGTTAGTWANAWKAGFAGWDIWGTGTDHPQGAGYIHAQGIVSGQHYATSDGGAAYGWMIVGATNATANRYWARGKWGGGISGWKEFAMYGGGGSGDLYAGRFYDSDNTGYYADPASTNNFNQTEQNGRLWYSNYLVSRNTGGLMGDYNASGTSSKLIWTIGESWPIGNMYGLGYEYASSTYLPGDPHVIALRNNGTTYTRLQMNGGIYTTGAIYSTVAMYTPIYYDSNNTGYYADPASTSNLNVLNHEGEYGRWWEPKGVGGDSGNGAHAYRIFQEGGGWGYPYPDLRIAYHVGIKMGANSGYEGIRIYDDYTMGTIRWQFNGGSGYQYQYTWTNLTGYHGLYSSLNGAHIYPNNGTYGSWKIDGNRNGWGGIEFSYANTTLMMNTDTYGFYNYSSGWRFYNTGGSGYFPGNVVAYWSDRRLKENIKELERGTGLDLIYKLKPSKFNWKKEAAEVTGGVIEAGKEEVSIIAQEAQEVLYDAVVINKTGKKGVVIDGEEINDYLTINYDKITPFLIQAIKDLKDEIDDLKQEMKILKGENK